MANQSIQQLKDGVRNTNPGRGAGQRRGYKSSMDNLIDSTMGQLVIGITAVSESTQAQGSAILPAHSIIHELEVVCTSGFTLDASTLMSLNVGTASLDTTGGSV